MQIRVDMEKKPLGKKVVGVGLTEEASCVVCCVIKEEL